MTTELQNIKVTKPMVAIVIMASAIGFPVYFLFGESMSAPTAMQWLLISLYSLAVLSFTLMGIGVKSVNVTSEETDTKLKEKKVAFDKAVKPYLYAILIAGCLWFGYQIFSIIQNNA